MKAKFFIPVVALVLFSCSGNKASNDAAASRAENQETETPVLEGQWRLADYPGESEMMVIDDSKDYVLAFNNEDGTFGLSTDCNSIGGRFTVSGDSLTFNDIAVTQMSCPEENVERAMLSILPTVATYAVSGDSVLILRADARTVATFRRK